MKPENRVKEKISFYKDYFLLLPNHSNTIQQIKLDLGRQKCSSRYDFYNTGCWYADAKEHAIKDNPSFYIKNEKTFHKIVNKTITFNETVMSQNLEALKKIKKLSIENNIQLILFVTPHNHNMMNEINFEDYIVFLSLLGDISNYWDFSGYNSVTKNDENYYEYSHYRPKVSKLIVGRIFDDTILYIPSDFGVFVTKDTLQKHVSDLKLQRRNYKDNNDAT